MKIMRAMKYVPILPIKAENKQGKETWVALGWLPNLLGMRGMRLRMMEKRLKNPKYTGPKTSFEISRAMKEERELENEIDQMRNIIFWHRHFR